MTTHEFALSDLAVRLAGTDASLSTSLRDILTVALQELIEAELTATIGAAPGERSTDRVTQRNGHRPKLVSTPGGDVELGIPKIRKGSFFPELLEPRRRIDKALWAVIMTAYIRHLDPQGRRSGQSVGLRLGDLEVDGVEDLHPDRRRRHRAQDTPLGSSAVRVRLVGRHLRPCP